MSRWYRLEQDEEVALVEVVPAGRGVRCSLWRARHEQGSLTEHEDARELPEDPAGQLLRGGYRELEAGAAAGAREEARRLLEERHREREAPGERLVPWEELRARCGTPFHADPDQLPPALRRFAVREGPTRLPGLRLGWDELGAGAQTRARQLAFLGDLELEGDLDAGDLTSSVPLLVLVRGHLRARSLLLTGWCELVVEGDVTLSGSLLACQGEPGGRLEVQGALRAAELLGGGMFTVHVAGALAGRAAWLTDDDPPLPQAELAPASLPAAGGATPLHPDLYQLDFDGEARSFTVEQAVARLRRGERLLI